MDQRHKVAALHCVERNPVRAGLVELPWRYPWSSTARRAGVAETDVLLGADAGWFEELAGGWRKFLLEPATRASSSTSACDITYPFGILPPGLGSSGRLD